MADQHSKVIRVVAELSSRSPMSHSQFVLREKPDRMLHEEWEEEIWRDRMHVDKKGNVIISESMVKKTLDSAAQYLSMKVKGKGQATYSKHFFGGVMVEEPIVTNCKLKDVEAEPVMCGAQGQKGGTGGSMVKRIYPRVLEWKGTLKALIVDEIITEDVFTKHLQTAGLMIGFGRWRPRNGGIYGRFGIDSIKFESIPISQVA